MPQSRLSIALIALVPLALASLARPAAAQSPSDADALFQHGLDAMRAANYEVACPLLEASYRKDPLPGALFTLAECEHAGGKLTAAIAHYRTFLEMLPSLAATRRRSFEERRGIALQKIELATAALPAMTISVDASLATSPGRGLVVKRNGVVVDASSYGVTQKIDPGEYIVTGQTPDGGAWQRRVELGERDRVVIEIPVVLQRASSAAEGASSGTAAAADTGTSSASSGRKTWGYVAGGVGIAGLMTGAIAGFVALGDKSTVNANCPNHLCNAQGESALDAGKTSSLVSTIALPVGVAGIGAAGILLLIAAPKSTSARTTAPTLRPSVAGSAHGASVVLEGTF
jgi:hypothetical protein